MSQDYNKTLNLPKTDFPMRAGLPQSEPVTLKKWEENKIYDKLMEKNEGKPLYILHDGPPYANGGIHMGTALNKVLKDFIIRYKNMAGFKAPYVPGWDTHGLPTELKARKKAGVGNSTTIDDIELRNICRDFALEYLDQQRNEFKRLGVTAEWDNPYITLLPEFEAKQIEIFAKMAEKGYIYRGLKPVYWCAECKTALAEAEIEYADDPCYSIYVKFQVTDDKGVFSKVGVDPSKVNFVIWTTTTWTIPANMAICLGPDFEYSLIKANDEYYVMATELYKGAMETAEISEYEVVATFKGNELELIETKHPYLDKMSLVIVGDHVTLESGTGCVHTAPGHGVDDFIVCKNYPQLNDIVVPVDADGKLTEEAGQFAGLSTEEANKPIALHLNEIGRMFATKKITHQYPHCWRCKKPVIFRATDQWFCSVDDFKDEACEAINTVNWIPAWGRDRITNMVRERKDWCISRQRKWGVPIPVFYCKECGEPLFDKEAMQNVADLFRKEGSDAWFKHDAKDFLVEGTKCSKCGCTDFDKEQDIMDVWFDSGSSYAAVLMQRDYLNFPADLYLEGADQYRGWFQSSLLTSVANFNQAPYKTVLTHGWVVDGEGRKMSKSLGNGIVPNEIIDKFGADVLRLWVASSDYHVDIRISNDILKQLSEAYRKIRNTARFILGNISDFDPDNDMMDIKNLNTLDTYALYATNKLIALCKEAYDNFEFHKVYHAVYHFCTVSMSNFYLDSLKDRLYCENTDGEKRRAAQTTIYIILDSLTRIIAPMIPFTSDEIWRYMPHSSSDDKENVLFNSFPELINIDITDEQIYKFSKLADIRNIINKYIEKEIQSKNIKSSLEVSLKVTANNDDFELLNAENIKPYVKEGLIISDFVLNKKDSGEIEVSVEKASGEKCERCWCISESVGQDPDHPTLCKRCSEVLN